VTIGKLAKRALVNIQTVRFYEREGILRPKSRSSSGYRIYDEESVKRLRFIKQAKELGFTLQEIKSLLNLRVSSVPQCGKVRRKAEDKLNVIQEKLKNMKRIEKNLKSLINDCRARVVSDTCPILEKMEG
jgi:Hg(II)-responsive transcriptional regulator